MSVIEDAATALGADVATALYGVTGAGIKIGIISDSYDAHGGAAAHVAGGDLPQTTVESDSVSGTDEGQAMTELAYQVAPGASYYFATCGESLADFAAAVTALQTAGCTVIVDDVSFPTEESFYQTGTVLDLAIEAAVAAGASYFTAAGNSGDDYVQKGFAPISVIIPGISPNPLIANDLGGQNPYQDIAISEGADVTIDLEWAQPFATIGTGSGGALNSLAFYLVNSQGSIVASATEVDVGKNPSQAIQFVNTTGSTQFRLVVVENGGTTPAGQSFTISVLDSALATLQGADVGTGSGDIMGHALLSRVMLAVKTALAAADKIPTLVFDEIDTGVGGRLGAALGRKLAELARHHQVICVTHLPQVASYADHQWIIRKRTDRGPDPDDHHPARRGRARRRDRRHAPRRRRRRGDPPGGCPDARRGPRDAVINRLGSGI